MYSLCMFDFSTIVPMKNNLVAFRGIFASAGSSGHVVEKFKLPSQSFKKARSVVMVLMDTL